MLLSMQETPRPRRIVLTLPAEISKALTASAARNMRPGKSEALRFLVDGLRREGELPPRSDK